MFLKISNGRLRKALSLPFNFRRNRSKGVGWFLLQSTGEPTMNHAVVLRNTTPLPSFGAELLAGAPALSLITASRTGEPLFRTSYAADPCARVFDGELFVYVSHDPTVPHETRAVASGNGATPFVTNMSIADLHVFSASSASAPLRFRGVALKASDVPWASQRIVWAPDAIRRPSDRRFLIYFPALDRSGLWRIGVAEAARAQGPFVARSQPIRGSSSIDPHVHVDPFTGTATLIYGGLWGGQLDRTSNITQPERNGPSFSLRARGPLLAQLTSDYTEFASPPREIRILDESGRPLAANDTGRRFFEAAWLATRRTAQDVRHYLVYSTGDTHRLVYATSRAVQGPYTFQAELLPPVSGWSTHGSLVEFDGGWWLVYHDATLSGGDTPRRNLKAVSVTFDCSSLTVQRPFMASTLTSTAEQSQTAAPPSPTPSRSPRSHETAKPNERRRPAKSRQEAGGALLVEPIDGRT